MTYYPKFGLKMKQILTGLQKYNFYNTIFACKRISNQTSNLNPYDLRVLILDIRFGREGHLVLKKLEKLKK